jgi:hypothetical protein
MIKQTSVCVVPRIYPSRLTPLTMLTPGSTFPRIMETLILPFLMLILALDRHLAIENLALRQQLVVLKRQAKRPAVRTRDRIFWVILSRIWEDWKSALIVVKPETVIRWHRTGFRLLWKLKSRGRPGRPRVAPAIRRLIL